ncbi:protein of unknown function DUF177 [Nitrosococcus halophilus Nc 4]|uniref:Large ribosomal RNA subunit accumulation protein YceD n=1 Tax=Nitrosococcus halophilus (strain Nc4) TaxID=472759 RepID=D5BZF0_NITHN|nr:YceD family protein [Nitrosococcus halophilus]ADE16164.1 protein of unknown function DUF177 [Nitrosococcus halophilus Nc 4]
MVKSLPDRILPWQLARSGRTLQGQVPLAQMPQLGQEILNRQSVAEVELAFDCDEGGCCFAQGRIRADLQLVCQRCLQPVEIELDTQTKLGLMVAESEIHRWPDEYEPWIVEPEETASLWSLVEEELLLALPIVARHPLGECPQGEVPQWVVDQDKKEEQGTSQQGSSPFAVLKNFKIKDKRDP